MAPNEQLPYRRSDESEFSRQRPTGIPWTPDMHIIAEPTEASPGFAVAIDAFDHETFDQHRGILSSPTSLALDDTRTRVTLMRGKEAFTVHIAGFYKKNRAGELQYIRLPIQNHSTGDTFYVLHPQDSEDTQGLSALPPGKKALGIDTLSAWRHFAELKDHETHSRRSREMQQLRAEKEKALVERVYQFFSVSGIQFAIPTSIIAMMYQQEGIDPNRVKPKVTKALLSGKLFLKVGNVQEELTRATMYQTGEGRKGSVNLSVQRSADEELPLYVPRKYNSLPRGQQPEKNQNSPYYLHHIAGDVIRNMMSFRPPSSGQTEESVLYSHHSFPADANVKNLSINTEVKIIMIWKKKWQKSQR